MVKTKKESVPEDEEKACKTEDGEPSEEEKKKSKAKKEGDEDMEKTEETEEEKDVDMDDDEDDKKKKKSADASGQNPEQAGNDSDNASHSMSPGQGVPSTQDVFVPSSDVDASRDQETPMGKSVNPDLLKSPLFKQLSSQIDGIREAVSKKLDAVEKSVNDRLSNVMKDMGKIEKFYEKSFYKMHGEDVSPEGTKAEPISKQIESGKVRFSY